MSLSSSLSSYFLLGYEEELFRTRYKDPNVDDEETWDDVFGRVGEAIGQTEEQAERFRDMMLEGRVLPSSPQIWNYGSTRRSPRQGSSCFTGRLGDSIGDFIEADRQAHEIYMASGGLGVCGNEVRPRGCKIQYSKSRSVGVMGFGGPIRKMESTTGYITNGGRERGALMVQLGAWHPDAIEFILSKAPVSLGWLDDWPTNAMAVIEGHGRESTADIHRLIGRYSSEYVFNKEWPRMDDIDDEDTSAVHALLGMKVLKADSLGRLVPQVVDWSAGGTRREANRDWDLPLQNCNISVRVPDSLIEASGYEVVPNGEGCDLIEKRESDDWVFTWYSKEEPKEGQGPWTLTDWDGELEVYEDGMVFDVSSDNTRVVSKSVGDAFETAPNQGHYRYAVLISTWEGLKENLKPNPNNWKDVQYARFYRKVLMPALSRYRGRIKARQVLDLIHETAWKCGDPGIVFSDTYEKFQPVDSKVYGPRHSNPCSEYVNSPNGSCDLISVNLRHCAEEVEKVSYQELEACYPTADHGSVWTDKGLTTAEHWEVLRRTDAFSQYLHEVSKAAKDAYEYIMEAHEHNLAPVEAIQRMSHDVYRTVGVGLMGLAEALMMFHVKYGSVCGERFSASTMSEIALVCWEESFRYAMETQDERWIKPEAWDPDRMVDIFRHRLQFSESYSLSRDQYNRWSALIHRIRKGDHATNTTVTSVAPTGSISQIAGWMMTRQASNGIVKFQTVSGGGEPPYAWYIQRNDNSGMVEIAHDLWTKEEHHGKPWMMTSDSTSSEGHVTMQAALCAFCCMSVSKTINLPERATVRDVTRGYLLAHSMGIPGTALYRDRCKPFQVLTALECPSGDCSIEDKFGSTSLQATAK